MEAINTNRTLTIALVGVESTGKTTLAHQLSSYYKAPLVQEVAREYLNALGSSYTAQDVEQIAQLQYNHISEAQALNPKLLICDTELLVGHIWYTYKYKNRSKHIERLLEHQKVDCFLLLDLDLPWQNDPLRENPNLEERQELHNYYINALEQRNASYTLISGQGTERLYKAIQYIHSFIL